MLAQVEISQEICSILCAGATKASALFFYQRVFCFQGINRIFKVVIFSTLAVVLIWVILMEFLAGFQCHTDFPALWEPGEYTKHCTISLPFLLSLSISDVVLNAWILILPIVPVSVCSA